MYLLDTNVLSNLRQPKKWTPGFQKWNAELDPALAYISVVSEMEVLHGVHLARRSNPAFGNKLLDWFESTVRVVFEGRTLPVNSDVAAVASKIKLLPTRDTEDVLIAATALVYGYAVVTRNLKHFADTGVTVVNPWTD